MAYQAIDYSTATSSNTPWPNIQINENTIEKQYIEMFFKNNILYKTHQNAVDGINNYTYNSNDSIFLLKKKDLTNYTIILEICGVDDGGNKLLSEILYVQENGTWTFNPNYNRILYSNNINNSLILNYGPVSKFPTQSDIDLWGSRTDTTITINNAIEFIGPLSWSNAQYSIWKDVTIRLTNRYSTSTSYDDTFTFQIWENNINTYQGTTNYTFTGLESYTAYEMWIKAPYIQLKESEELLTAADTYRILIDTMATLNELVLIFHYQSSYINNFKNSINSHNSINITNVINLINTFDNNSPHLKYDDHNQWLSSIDKDIIIGVRKTSDQTDVHETTYEINVYNDTLSPSTWNFTATGMSNNVQYELYLRCPDMKTQDNSQVVSGTFSSKGVYRQITTFTLYYDPVFYYGKNTSSTYFTTSSNTISLYIFRLIQHSDSTNARMENNNSSLTSNFYQVEYGLTNSSGDDLRFNSSFWIRESDSNMYTGNGSGQISNLTNHVVTYTVSRGATYSVYLKCSSIPWKNQTNSQNSATNAGMTTNGALGKRSTLVSSLQSNNIPVLHYNVDTTQTNWLTISHESISISSIPAMLKSSGVYNENWLGTTNNPTETSSTLSFDIGVRTQGSTTLTNVPTRGRYLINEHNGHFNSSSNTYNANGLSRGTMYDIFIYAKPLKYKASGGSVSSTGSHATLSSFRTLYDPVLEYNIDTTQSNWLTISYNSISISSIPAMLKSSGVYNENWLGTTKNPTETSSTLSFQIGVRTPGYTLIPKIPARGTYDINEHNGHFNSSSNTYNANGLSSGTTYEIFIYGRSLKYKVSGGSVSSIRSSTELIDFTTLHHPLLLYGPLSTDINVLGTVTYNSVSISNITTMLEKTDGTNAGLEYTNSGQNINRSFVIGTRQNGTSNTGNETSYTINESTNNFSATTSYSTSNLSENTTYDLYIKSTDSMLQLKSESGSAVSENTVNVISTFTTPYQNTTMTFNNNYAFSYSSTISIPKSSLFNSLSITNSSTETIKIEIISTKLM